MGSPLAPPPPVNLPTTRADDTAVVVTTSERPATPTGPAAAQFGGAAASDFTDEPTVVGDAVQRASEGGSSTQLRGASDFDDFDDFDLGLEHDEATQVLDQSSIAAAKLEALRAKSAEPDVTEFDTLRPPTPAASAAALANKSPNLDDDFEVAETEPPPAGLGIDGRIPEASLSLTDALELDDFVGADRLGRTLDSGDDEVDVDDGPVMGGAANPGPVPVRPQGYHQSQSGTEEDTEIVAGLTKQLESRAEASPVSSSRGWLWATLAIVGVIGVAVGGWYAAPALLGAVAHSEDTVEHTPVPPQGTAPPTGDTPPATADAPVAVAQPDVPPTPTPDVPPTADVPPATPPTPEVVAVAEPTPPPTPVVAPPTPVVAPPTPVVEPPTPTPTAPVAVNTAGLPSDPVEASAALVTRARQQAGGGDRAGAEASLRQALTLDAENYEAMATLAEVLVARGQNDEALDLAQTAVRRRARVGRYHLIYGDVRAAMGDRPGASRSWSRATDVDPSLAGEVSRRRNN